MAYFVTKIPTKHLPADERRAITVDAVVALAAHQNPHDITTSAIAKQMGVSQGALFKHFPSKDAILKAVMEWVAERLMPQHFMHPLPLPQLKLFFSLISNLSSSIRVRHA